MSATSAAPTLTRYKFTTDDYHRMRVFGILSEDSRVELIEGEIVAMSPIGSRHMECVKRLNGALVLAVEDAAVVSVQNPVRLSDLSEPQPDTAVLRARDYAAALPGPADILLLVEVADTTLAYDSTTKLALYARAGVPCVVIVVLPGRVVARYSDPRDGDYRRIDRCHPDDTVAFGLLPGLAVSLPAGAILS